MKPSLQRQVEQFVEGNIVAFHENRAANLDRLELGTVLKAKNP